MGADESNALVQDGYSALEEPSQRAASTSRCNASRSAYSAHDARHREQNLIALAEQAHRAQTAKAEFLSRVAHDIRTPLNAVRGFTDIALENLDDPARVRASLEKIKQAGEFLQEIVDGVLDLTRIERGDTDNNLKETSLSRVFDNISSLIDGAYYGKGVRRDFKLEPLVHDRVFIDGSRLEQVCTNLLSNAMKYTPEGGLVTFRMREDELPGKVKVRLICTISDTGIGMTPEFMEHMYESFTRAVDTRVNQVPGSGLGLTVVRQLVDIMDGRIEAQSEPGHGTTFTVSFDVDYVDARKKGNPLTFADAAEACRGMRVLVAEDNDLNYEVAEELLASRGVVCARAENGEACVEEFASAPEHTYDAILMDLMMPVMDGLQATRTIRELDKPDSKSIAIVALTANAFSSDAQNCRDAGMNAHFPKPLDVDKLLATLASLKRSSVA